MVPEEFPNALGATKEASQIAMLVKDVRTAAEKYTKLLSVPTPPITHLTQKSIDNAIYRGRKSTGGIEMACFYFRFNYGLELMQPDDGESFWHECLDRHGEGVNHIAYDVTDMDSAIEKMEQLGYPLIQRGYFDDGNGGYAYFDTFDDLKVYVELLHHTNRQPFGAENPNKTPML